MYVFWRSTPTVCEPLSSNSLWVTFTNDTWCPNGNRKPLSTTLTYWSRPCVASCDHSESCGSAGGSQLASEVREPPRALSNSRLAEMSARPLRVKSALALTICQRSNEESELVN